MSNESLGRSVGNYFFHSGKKAPAGSVVADGTMKNNVDYPELVAFANAENLMISEAQWQALAAAQESVPFYAYDGGSSTFRLPRIKSFLRGTDTPSRVGIFESDAIRNIVGALTTGVSTDVQFLTDSGSLVGSGALSVDERMTTYSIQNGPTKSWYPKSLNFDASKAVPTAEENRPKTIYALLCIQAVNVASGSAPAPVVPAVNLVLGGAEVKTNELYNGKPLYKKLINFGALPNAAAKTFMHGISGMEYYALASGSRAINAAGTVLAFPHLNAESLTYCVGVTIDQTSIKATAGINRSDFNAEICIMYTKTTDAVVA